MSRMRSHLAIILCITLAIVAYMLLANCMEIEEGYDAKFSNRAHTDPPNSPYHNNLMKKIVGGAKKLNIHVKYSGDLNLTKVDKNKIEEIIHEDLNMLLKPLRDKGYDIVQKDKINVKEKSFFGGKPDLTIEFVSNSSKASNWVPGKITMYEANSYESKTLSGDNLLPGTEKHSRSTLRHELLHALGLNDTDKDRAGASTGGSPNTAGKHLESLASCYHNAYHDFSILATPTKDDISGVIHYYNSLKHGSPSNDCKASMVTAITDTWNSVNVNKRYSNEGRTVEHFLVGLEYSNESDAILDALLNAGANIKAKDNSGKTALYYAEDANKNETFGAENKFPDSFLKRLGKQP